MPTNVYEKKVFNLILNFFEGYELQINPINAKKKPDGSGLKKDLSSVYNCNVLNNSIELSLYRY